MAVRRDIVWRFVMNHITGDGRDADRIVRIIERDMEIMREIVEFMIDEPNDARDDERVARIRAMINRRIIAHITDQFG